MKEIGQEFIVANNQDRYTLKQIETEYLGKKVLYRFVEKWKENMYKYLINIWKLPYDSVDDYNEYLNEPDNFGLTYEYYLLQTKPLVDVQSKLNINFSSLIINHKLSIRNL